MWLVIDPPALIFAVKFHEMFLGRRFTLLTDLRPLLAIFGSRNGLPVYTANRWQRWPLTLLVYDFEIEYRSTPKFGKAEALSRLIAAKEAVDEEKVIATVSVGPDFRKLLADTARALPVTAKMIAEATVTGKELQCVIQAVTKIGWKFFVELPF